MLKISFSGCLSLSSVIAAQFTLEIRVAAQNREKLLETPIFGVQCHSRSSMLVPPESL